MQREDSSNAPTRRNFIKASSISAASLALTGSSIEAAMETENTRPTRSQKEIEWRNKQPGMAYRKLGATGLMVSEMVMGAIPIKFHNLTMVDVALDLGINYIDTAVSYGKDNESEKALGKYFKDKPAAREKVFLASKLSPFGGYRSQMYKDIFESLPSEKQNAIIRRAREIVEERSVGKPGVFFAYFPGQERELDWEYRIIAMQKDYGHRVDGNGKFRNRMFEILEESLKRTGQDHYDVLFCPHGCASPEQLEEPEMLDTLQAMKKQGKCRFVAVSTHTAFEQVMRKAANLEDYDVVMAAYNVINHGSVENAIAYATERGVGVIAMKAAAAVRTHFDQLQPLAEWREQKLNQILPGEESAPVRAYQFVLQNQNVSAVISNMWNEDMLRENATAVGREVKLITS